MEEFFVSQQRVQKFIAQTGLASRRKAEALIKQGRVTINNKTAVLGDKVGADDQVHVDDELVKEHQTDLQILLLNKPEGYITTRNDPQHRKSVFELLPELKQGRWINIGRLDLNTSGLLLFTTDGGVANQLMHPSANLEREYLCRVYGTINNNKINKIKNGVKLKPENILAKFKSVTAVTNVSKNQWYKVVLMQGRYREVRRIWQSVDCQVSRLSRIRFANIHLPEELAKGKHIYLTQEQVATLKQTIQKPSC